jgi:hypothetical protein
MASDTAPAAVPDPIGQPATDTSTGPATGPVTGLLAPIEPARPTSAAFNLDPSAVAPDAAGSVDQAPASASSSTYQNDTDITGAKDGKNSSNKQQTGVMRAFALAAIERWKKGADARNKRLDIQKAKASAHQTKESRTVNRSEKFAGGSTNSGTASGKSLDSKTHKGAGGSGNGGSKNGSQKNGGSKNSSSGNGSGGGSRSGGRSGSGGASGSGGSAGGRGSSGASGRGAAGNSNSGTSPKTSKTDFKGHSGSSQNGTDSKKNGRKDAAGTKTDTATCGDSSGISLTKDKKSKNRDNKSDARKNGRTDTTDAKGSSKDTTSGRTSNGKGADAVGSSAKPSNAGDTKTGKTRKSSKDSNPAASGTPINTQPSREAGYRDGSRTAKATAHVKAYRDGFKDGHHDTSKAAEREKQRLDEAHEARKQQRAKDQPVTASSADHQPQGPQPIDVKEVTDTHVTLDSGKTYTRGEVRNLKQYERRMAVKATNMGKAAEGTRQLEAHAEQQADKAFKFLEMAKTVEGGDRFVGILTRLHEAATIQIREAQELHKRVVRAAENTRVVLVNVEIRYGGIYKAVCESPLTKPAELNWYRK